MRLENEKKNEGRKAVKRNKGLETRDKGRERVLRDLNLRRASGNYKRETSE